MKNNAFKGGVPQKKLGSKSDIVKRGVLHTQIGQSFFGS
jgi:hypothetical protein